MDKPKIVPMGERLRKLRPWWTRVKHDDHGARRASIVYKVIGLPIEILFWVFVWVTFFGLAIWFWLGKH
jgi:hypothetical protein